MDFKTLIELFLIHSFIHFFKVSSLQEGADVPLDGSNIAVKGYENGNFIGATVIAGVKPHMECYKVRLSSKSFFD